MSTESECENRFYNGSPRSLFDTCLEYFVNNLYKYTSVEVEGGHPQSAATVQSVKSIRYRLSDNVALPSEISERILDAYQKDHRLNDNVAHLFRDLNKTRLRTLKLRNSRITDAGFRCLMKHKPYHLELMKCEYLSQVSLDIINEYDDNLVSIKVGQHTYILSQDETVYRHRGYIINPPNLKKLAIQRRDLAIFPMLMLKPLVNLTHLDLSECTSAGSIGALKLEKLISLTLYNALWAKDIIDWMAGLRTLRHLDISQPTERHGKYPYPNEVLAKLVNGLPYLDSLDISGTNLAGSGAAVIGKVIEGQPTEARTPVRCDIPGLVSRVNKPLHFLGLYGTHHGACKRHDIPAKVISGDANEHQVLTAATAYIERPAMLTRVLNDLYYLFRYETNIQVGRALDLVLDAMEHHVGEKHIQISGSATLFYIVKGKEKANININQKKRIINALLVGMEAHVGNDTMMRNGCLTLCQFKIPTDVLFQYDRVVLILLNGVADVNQEGFVQRIAIYLLNSLACQVDGTQKMFLGSKGAIGQMLHLISDRVERRVCDEVLEVAWSTMWNVTDETPQNCRKFLENRGMEYFLACLKSFPDKEELLRNMMGLLGNVAEVGDLRPQLMNKRFLTVFYELLNSTSDGIEVSYNAAGVMAHMASDGPSAWAVSSPTREDVLTRLVEAVKRWDLWTQRNINYRSFKPILNLLKAHHTPPCQYWALWALANLTTVYGEKYSALVMAEGGMALLEELMKVPDELDVVGIKVLAQKVIENCVKAVEG